MEPRNYIGLLLVLAGVVLQSIGWIYSTIVAVLSFVLIALGLAIFITQRVLEKMEDREFGHGGGGGPAVPGDIHDYSGWGKGGRSDAWQSSSGGGDGGGGE